MTSDIHKNNPRLLNLLLRAVPVRHDRFKTGAAFDLEGDIASFVHPEDSHDRDGSGIHQRIETLDLIH